MPRDFKSIKAWQFADDLVVAVYGATKAYPADERYGLIQQMRRAVVSVGANIAEGATRSSEREFVQFLSIAKGSLAELEYYLHVSHRLGYLTDHSFLRLLQLHQSTARTLHGLLRAIDRRMTEHTLAISRT